MTPNPMPLRKTDNKTCEVVHCQNDVKGFQVPIILGRSSLSGLPFVGNVCSRHKGVLQILRICHQPSPSPLQLYLPRLLAFAMFIMALKNLKLVATAQSFLFNRSWRCLSGFERDYLLMSETGYSSVVWALTLLLCCLAKLNPLKRLFSNSKLLSLPAQFHHSTIV